jgi:formamidopyrimidine-DNA glycosylase
VPELPEAQVIAADLDRALKGSVITGITVWFSKALRPDDAERIPGHVLEGAERLGKMIRFRLSEDLNLVCSLRMTGQFVFGREYEDGPEKDPRTPAARIRDGRAPPLPHARLAFRFKYAPGKEDLGTLFYRDVRKFGRLTLFEGPDFMKFKRDSVARDPFEFDPGAFRELVKSSRKPVKTLLMDQRSISGIGNIYATEILFASGIHPSRPANDLSPKDADRILANSREILKLAVSGGGSTIANFEAPSGKGSFQLFHKVYGKKGENCPVCGRPLSGSKTGGRTSVYCENCQK